jgi:predicted RNA binding protein YcfA (HicA-like mRNA interferase family)
LIVAKLPVLKPREVVALLEAQGFIEVRQRGAHKQFRHPDGRGTTVPFHKGRDVSPVLLRKIARDIGLTAESLLGIAPEEAPEPEGEQSPAEGTEPPSGPTEDRAGS